MKATVQCAAVPLLGLLAWMFATNSVAQAVPPPTGLSPLRVLILSGGGNHDWRQTSPFLGRLLENSGRFEVRINGAPSGLTASTLAPFDVVVSDCEAASLGEEAEKALERYVKSGKGLVLTRGGLAGQSASSQWNRLVGMSRSTRPGAAVDAPFRLIALNQVLTRHPVMSELNGNWRTGDRTLRGLVPSTASEVLARSDRNEPLLITSTPAKGRVFGTALGCDVGAMQEKIFITTFLRGTEWAASGRVTLPSEMMMPEPETNGVRILIVTGGHDHEAGFYGLFDGYKDIGWAPVSDSTLAFKQDLRAKFDVLVFYDFTRDLDDKGRKHLRDFVESGKGIVVLHHGILNFQRWPWWYEEVVGGLYRLERQGTIPNSTVKFGEEHLLTPVGDHPITAGIGPFHVTDETYKGLFISPNVKPLLITDNATSDPTVAWIGPCTTSKVVFIQLGHDHSPFRHPSYRALVHNSILWTAGKLK